MSNISLKKCNRLSFFVFLILLAAFEFAKAPIKSYLARSAQDAQIQVYAKKGPEIIQMQQELFKRPGRQMTTEQIEQLRVQQNKQAEEMRAAIQELTAEGHAVGSWHKSLYFLTVMALGLVTIVTAAWMVFARLKDIGWPIWVGFAIFVPPFAARFFGAGLPLPVFQIAQASFLLALAGLAMIPSNFGGTQRKATSNRGGGVLPTAATMAGVVVFALAAVLASLPQTRVSTVSPSPNLPTFSSLGSSASPAK